MNGLELSRAYYEAYGKPMLERDFPDLLPLIAVGLMGSGSECYGYDDGLSRDHDFEPGFCIFLPGEDEVDRSKAFRLERAYAKLPRSMDGASRSLTAPTGGARKGVLRTAEFFTDKVGSPDGRLTVDQWLRLPDYALSEATNGVIFDDSYGEVTGIRDRLADQPEDVRRKKLAGHVLLMAQAGQYNYARCLKHGETGAAQLAVMRFVESAMQAVFLLNRTYMPYYKWAFRALRALPRLSLLAELMECLITTGNDGESAADKQDMIESIAADVIDELIDQDLTKANCGDLEKHAYSIQDGIRDASVRNMHILAAV
ncbi:MAG: DUF4037 domain-containing protein [Clostridia bacterium]|nr:DUF4037 domain-containing protein [Clostridia bacterium]